MTVVSCTFDTVFCESEGRLSVCTEIDEEIEFGVEKTNCDVAVEAVPGEARVVL